MAAFHGKARDLAGPGLHAVIICAKVSRFLEASPTRLAPVTPLGTANRETWLSRSIF
jgi:hypothetical protein